MNNISLRNPIDAVKQQLDVVKQAKQVAAIKVGFRRWLAFLIIVSCNQVFADSRCTETHYYFAPSELICSYRVTKIPSSWLTTRDVLWQLPLGEAPAGGWPVVLVYQGSLYPVEFSRKSTALYGGYYELQTIRKLLDSGYAVLAPRAAADLAWFTNTLSPFTPYEWTTDFGFLNNVFSAIKRGQFGPLNTAREYATGISSGGYNTSRMALTWPGQFKALVVHSASWATCGGSLCVLPLYMPTTHPPTKFLQGFLDPLAPWWTMQIYYDRLLYEGIETEQLTMPMGGHEWFSVSPAAVVDWFDRHP